MLGEPQWLGLYNNRPQVLSILDLGGGHRHLIGGHRLCTCGATVEDYSAGLYHTHHRSTYLDDGLVRHRNNVILTVCAKHGEKVAHDDDACTSNQRVEAGGGVGNCIHHAVCIHYAKFTPITPYINTPCIGVIASIAQVSSSLGGVNATHNLVVLVGKDGPEDAEECQVGVGSAVILAQLLHDRQDCDEHQHGELEAPYKPLKGEAPA